LKRGNLVQEGKITQRQADEQAEQWEKVRDHYYTYIYIYIYMDRIDRSISYDNKQCAMMDMTTAEIGKKRFLTLEI
jgi:hypothetical protein